ncbi:MAG: prolyl oligopeptidase family serine peptidase [Eubacteriales bacterium]
MENRIYRHPYFGEMYYLAYVPQTLKTAANRPLLVFLHGAGERGKDFELIKKHAVPRYLEEGMDIPAVVLCPQCPTGLIWNNLVLLLKDFLEDTMREYAIDPAKVSLTGISMGGYGTWEMAMCFPSMFRKIAPVCGGGTPWRTNLITAQIRAFHGDKDDCVPPESSYQMVDAAIKAGKDARLTVFHNVGHASWDDAYLTTNVLSWLTED